MGFNIFETYQATAPIELIRGITPVKTEPDVLRGISELISMQVLTQQLITQLVSAQVGKAQTGQAFIGQGQRANEGAAFDESANQVKLLSQRVDELEKRLDESTKKTAAAGRA